jgi:N-formylglutamate amidohydrolase
MVQGTAADVTESMDHPAFFIRGDLSPLRPVLLSVPHSGRAYSARLLAAARVPVASLRRLEDNRADLLVGAAVAAGFRAIVATAPRAEIDLNRAEQDMDPTALVDPPTGLRPSQRARAGLGLVPTHLFDAGPLWREPLSKAELSQRIEGIHRPYHAAIEAMLDAATVEHGAAILLDIHSMPPPKEPVDIVFGDRFGLTADSRLVDALMACAEGAGFRAARNHPYAGAHAIERHASRRRSIHAVQVELGRDCYLNGDGTADAAGLARSRALIRHLAETACRYLNDGRMAFPMAAE